MRFFQRIRNGFARFMYGRCGMDQLGMTLLWTGIILGILEMLVSQKNQTIMWILEVLSTADYIYFFVRALSKNLYKRQKENSWFCNRFYWPMQNAMRNAKQRRMDKEHKYFVCKNCRTVCRVPRGKGKVIITCPKCHAEIHGKS